MNTALVRSVFLLVACALAACGDHYSTQDATKRCEEERRTKQTVVEASFRECVACYEQCGADCAPQSLSPERYICPD